MIEWPRFYGLLGLRLCQLARCRCRVLGHFVAISFFWVCCPILVGHRWVGVLVCARLGCCSSGVEQQVSFGVKTLLQLGTRCILIVWLVRLGGALPCLAMCWVWSGLSSGSFVGSLGLSSIMISARNAASELLGVSGSVIGLWGTGCSAMFFLESWCVLGLVVALPWSNRRCPLASRRLCSLALGVG